jgi:hypothetical protein
MASTCPRLPTYVHLPCLTEFLQQLSPKTIITLDAVHCDRKRAYRCLSLFFFGAGNVTILIFGFASLLFHVLVLVTVLF